MTSMIEINVLIKMLLFLNRDKNVSPPWFMIFILRFSASSGH